MRVARIWYLRSDIVRPQRMMILREDTTGVVHWATFENEDSPLAGPHCSDAPGLVIFWRGSARKIPEYPTCLWCALEDATMHRGPGSETFIR